MKLLGVLRWATPYVAATTTWVLSLWVTSAHAASPSAAAGTSETVITVGLAGLMSLFSGVLTHFVTRREWSSKVAEVERRISVIELGPTRVEHTGVVDRVERMEAAMRTDIGNLHEKVNRVDRAVAGVETETRLQSATLDLIAVKLRIKP